MEDFKTFKDLQTLLGAKVGNRNWVYVTICKNFDIKSLMLVNSIYALQLLTVNQPL